MKMFSVAPTVLLTLATMVGAGNAQAGCWPVFSGIHSHMECDSAGATPTFENFKKVVNDTSKLSPACKKSILNVAVNYYSCASAIYGGAMSGGVLVWVGAGEACYEFSEVIKDNAEKCKTYVNLRTKPIKAKVCNERSYKLNVAIARREVMDKKITSGWFSLESGECKTFSYSNARVIYAMALTPNGGRVFPNFHTEDLDDNATFCINKSKKFDNADVDTCHNKLGDNPYDYNKSGNWKFTNFGRISGLKNGHTFKE